MPTSGEKRCILPPRPLRAPGHAAIEFGDHLARGHTFGQGMAMAAVRAEDGIILTQMSAYAGRHRFLAHVGVTGAVNQTGCVGFRQLLFSAPNHQHAAI